MQDHQQTTGRNQRDGGQYALHREAGLWQLTFAGRQARFKHELGALYVAYLLRSPPREPIHAAARPGSRPRVLGRACRAGRS